ncbi:MAG: acyl-CoA dehydrogenase [Microbacterium sp.]
MSDVPMPAPARLRRSGDAPAIVARAVDDAGRITGFGTDVDATIGWAVGIGHSAPLPGHGETSALWELLATTSALDVAAARILEPHLDALAILAQAEAEGTGPALAEIDADATSSWGVYAAEGPQGRLNARAEGSTWRLSGTRPWCSLAGSLSHALVTAWVDDGERRLFAVDLRQPMVVPRIGPWHARGLAQIVSAAVDFSDAVAVPIGETSWYLRRPGFAWGGMGVAAAWWGGAAPITEALTRAGGRPDPDQLALSHLGEADAISWSVRAVLADAASAIDEGVDRDEARLLAERVRAHTAAGVERILVLADHALGPAPLTTDEDHARRVADLRIYLRQHHAERDLARLGRLLTAR